MKLTGSRIKLAAHCLYPFNDGVHWSDGGPRAASSAGRAAHECIERSLAGDGAAIEETCAAHGLDAAQTRAVANTYEAWCAWHDETARPPMRPEVAFAFDVEAGGVRELGARLGRAYDEAGRRPTEIVVTVDAVFHADGCAYVYDWKTGRQEHREPIAEHRQLRAGALCAARVHGCDSAVYAVVYLDEYGARAEAHELDVFDLDAIESELAELGRKVLSSDATPMPGMHCSELWCPALAACPVHTQALAEIAPIEAAELPSTVSPATIVDNAHAGRIVAALKALESKTEQAWAAVREWIATHGPATLPDGSRYEKRQKSRETIVATPEGMLVLSSILGEQAAREAVKSTVSKEAIKAATLAVAGRGKERGVLERRVYEELQAVGATHESHFEQWEIVKPRKRSEEAA